MYPSYKKFQQISNLPSFRQYIDICNRKHKLPQDSLDYLHIFEEEGDTTTRLILGTHYYFNKERNYEGFQLMKHAQANPISKYIYSMAQITVNLPAAYLDRLKMMFEHQ